MGPRWPHWCDQHQGWSQNGFSQHSSLAAASSPSQRLLSDWLPHHWICTGVYVNNINWVAFIIPLLAVYIMQSGKQVKYYMGFGLVFRPKLNCNSGGCYNIYIYIYLYIYIFIYIHTYIYMYVCVCVLA